MCDTLINASLLNLLFRRIKSFLNKELLSDFSKVRKFNTYLIGWAFIPKGGLPDDIELCADANLISSDGEVLEALSPPW